MGQFFGCRPEIMFHILLILMVLLMPVQRILLLQKLLLQLWKKHRHVYDDASEANSVQLIPHRMSRMSLSLRL